MDHCHVERGVVVLLVDHRAGEQGVVDRLDVGVEDHVVAVAPGRDGVGRALYFARDQAGDDFACGDDATGAEVVVGTAAVTFAGAAVVMGSGVIGDV